MCPSIVVVYVLDLWPPNNQKKVLIINFEKFRNACGRKHTWDGECECNGSTRVLLLLYLCLLSLTSFFPFLSPANRLTPFSLSKSSLFRSQPTPNPINLTYHHNSQPLSLSLARSSFFSTNNGSFPFLS